MWIGFTLAAVMAGALVQQGNVGNQNQQADRGTPDKEQTCAPSRPKGFVDETSSEKGNPDRVLVVDLAPVPLPTSGDVKHPITLIGGSASRMFVLPGCSSDASVKKLWEDIKKIGLSKEDSVQPKDSSDQSALVEKTIKYLRDNAKELARESNTRWRSHEGDRLDIYVLRLEDRAVNLGLEETPRRSRIVSDIASLAVLSTKMLRGLAAPTPRYGLSYASYYLKRPRADLQVSAALTTLGVDGANQPPGGHPAAPKANPDSTSITLRTGSGEHLFISANVTANNAEALDYDDTKHELTLASKPSQFFVSLNFTPGDLSDAKDDAGFSGFLRNWFLGFTAQATARPFDQIGMTLGYRGPLPWLGDWINFSTVSPYSSLVWIKTDYLPEGDTTNVKRHFGRRNFLFGVSLNLDKAVEWVSSDDKAKDGGGGA